MTTPGIAGKEERAVLPDKPAWCHVGGSRWRRSWPGAPRSRRRAGHRLRPREAAAPCAHGGTEAQNVPRSRTIARPTNTTPHVRRTTIQARIIDGGKSGRSQNSSHVWAAS
jgi:hypothetical protein